MRGRAGADPLLPARHRARLPPPLTTAPPRHAQVVTAAAQFHPTGALFLDALHPNRMTTARSGARSMSAVDARPILVIANRTSSTPTLLHEVARCSAGARFTLMIAPDHGHHEDCILEAAFKLIERAAGADVASLADRGRSSRHRTTRRHRRCGSTH
jgi:hypothetical protein